MMKKLFLSAIISAASVFAMAQTQSVTHVVQRGETIESIAEYYHVSVDDINKANPNADGLVYVGMKLVVPTNTKENRIEKNYNQIENSKSVALEQTTNNNHSNNLNNGLTRNDADNVNQSFVIGEGPSFSFLYQSDAKIYGLQMELGTKLFCLTGSIQSNLKFGKKETTATAAYLGPGVRRRYIFNNTFILQGKIYPYIGLSQSNTPKNLETGQEAEDKTEFTYGASADISVGIKLWNTSKGNSTFLHFGYAIIANEFKTKGIFKSGCIMVGLTTVIK